MRHVVIVGASLAGLSSARALRAQGFDGALTVVGDEAYRPYDRPPLSKRYLTSVMPDETLSLERPSEDLAIRWELANKAIRLRAADRALDLADGSTLRWDGLILATGASARRMSALKQLGGVHVLRSIDDARALKADLRPGSNLIVVGAGFIGSEVASSARELGLDVTIVELADTPLAVQLGARLGSRVAELHAAHGTKVLCGVAVVALTGTDRVTGVELADGRRLAADVVVVGVGAVPNISWLADSGVAVGDGVLCDRLGRTSADHVVAVGDCAAWYNDSTASYQRTEHWSAAQERPAVAVAALLGTGRPIPTIGPAYFWSDQYKSRIQFAGAADRADDVAVEVDDAATGSLLATYRRSGRPVAVLGINQMRLFNERRRELAGN